LRRAFDYYDDAVRKQPKNPETWRAAGAFALDQRCFRSAYIYLEKFTELNQKARPSAGGDDYNRALREVNLGHNNC